MGRQRMQNAALIFMSVLLSFLAAESMLRWLKSDRKKYFVWQPNLRHIFYPDSTLFHGIKGASLFSINADGVRGQVFKDGNKRFLCLGGSTTECLYLDDKECWTKLLQDSLSQRFGKPYQVASIGKSGCTTRENYIHLKYFLPQLSKQDGVILMVGLNDMMKRLSRDSMYEQDFRFTPEVEDSFIRTIFLSEAESNTWWRNLELFKMGQQYFHRINKVDWESIQDDKGEVLKQWRNNRSSAGLLINELPDLTSALNEYERNLQLIYEEAQCQKIDVILVTQASLYKDSMGVFESNLLWMGGVGDFQKQINSLYYSPAVLNRALELYNQRLVNFCKHKRNVTLIDVAKYLPKDTSVFYDDCHFNERGARKVAGLVSRLFPDSPE